MNYQGPGKYLHYKGGEYEVLGLALQEDSLPKNDDFAVGTQFVIYRPLTPGSLLECRGEDFWAREFGDFNAQVPAPRSHKMPGAWIPRFQKIQTVRDEQ